MLSDASGRGGVLMDSARKVYIQLNRSGVEIWNALAEKRQPEEIIATLAATRLQPEAEVRAEVEAFIKDLLRRGVIENR